MFIRKFGHILLTLLMLLSVTYGYYTTNGQNIVDRNTGEAVQLRGIGIGGWLLPEGYMWGIRTLDRPRQFEQAIIDLIGERGAARFWDLYYSNFITREDVEVMRSWGVNTLRVPLNANMLMPLVEQPQEAPFRFSEDKFLYLDAFVDWCEELEMGIIWDMHGAPGAQSAENIADSDGEARLWTEKDIYWPRTIALWEKIVIRYVDYECIVGYDLLNEPLLGRYEGVDPVWLRELYVLLTDMIRETDENGIIFVEGDDWAQDFSMLEPLDWDPHLVIAFHSYPPTHTHEGLHRWDALRRKYNIPLWHGETGEQNPPWELYQRSTRLLAEQNVSWNWWTHKKFDLQRQPWSIPRTEGFELILDYWKGQGERPSRREARRWLFEQARRTNLAYCDFLPGMVSSLHPLDPSEYAESLGPQTPVILSPPSDLILEIGYAAFLEVQAKGFPLSFQWFRNDTLLRGAVGPRLAVHQLDAGQQTGRFQVYLSNEHGEVISDEATVSVRPFSGPGMPEFIDEPIIDGKMDSLWRQAVRIRLEHLLIENVSSPLDLAARAAMGWTEDHLYILVNVSDDQLSTRNTTDYLKDGIEIYLDGDNSKSAYYGEDESQLRFVWDSDSVITDIGHRIQGIMAARKETGQGYQMEVAIPWDSVNATGRPPEFLGFDIHVNDSDGHTRDAKLAWFATRDNSYQSPSVFGTFRLE